MKYAGMPMGMWIIFHRSFRRNLTEVLKYDEQESRTITAAAKKKYNFYEYEDGSGYEARFTRCGICTLMRELGIEELIPAMCRLDYTMSEAGGVTDFVREYTPASGGPYCDCGYKKKVILD